MKDNLEALMNTVIPLTQITEEQRDAWESDANAFVTAGTPPHATTRCRAALAAFMLHHLTPACAHARN